MSARARGLLNSIRTSKCFYKGSLRVSERICNGVSLRVFYEDSGRGSLMGFGNANYTGL